MQFDQDGHSDVQRQLLITLVHGTWGRGFFPKPQNQNRRPFWFEDGSPFLARLTAGLGDIPHKTWPLLWSGANSIFVTDKTAHALADHLAAEHGEHPKATQLVIAHSHGGNIALRALHHLQHRDASQLKGAESANPLVVTLATPFIEVHAAERPSAPHVRMTLILTILILFDFSMLTLVFYWEPLFESFEKRQYFSVKYVAFWIVFGFFSVLIHWWGLRWGLKSSTRRKLVQALNQVTQLGEAVSADRLLVIRAVNDEAALIMALGTIVNFLTERFILNVFTFVFPLLVGMGVIGWQLDWLSMKSWWNVTIIVALMSGVIVLVIMMYSLLMTSRLVHGRELATSPMECQINTQSTPDGVGAKIVTLVRDTYAKSLRHGIYDHEDCAKTVSDWVRFRLETN